jgi:hypothetical protein
MTTAEPKKADEDAGARSIMGGAFAGARPAGGGDGGGDPAPRRLAIKDPKAFQAASLRRREFDQNTWLIDMAAEDYGPSLTDARYWTAVADRLTPYDRIEVRSKDGEFVAQLVVVENLGGRQIKLAQVSKTILNDAAIAAPKATGSWYAISLGSRRWCVVDPQGRVAREGYFSREAAEYEMRVINGGHDRPRHPIMGN